MHNYYQWYNWHGVHSSELPIMAQLKAVLVFLFERLFLKEKTSLCLPPPPPNKKINKNISKLALPKHYSVYDSFSLRNIILHYRNLCFVTLYCITPHIILGTVRAIILSCINYYASFFGSKENLECSQSSTFSQQSLESIKAVYKNHLF